METITALEIAYSLSTFGIEAEIEAEPTVTQTQVDNAIATLDALPTKKAPAQMTAQELRKYCTSHGFKGAGRWTKAQCLAALGPQKQQAAKFIPEYRTRAQMVRGCSIE